MSAQSALETLQAALPYKHMFIGVGLDSDERDNPPTKFARVFELAREAGLHVTMHCDIDQVGSIDNIRARSPSWARSAWTTARISWRTLPWSPTRETTASA